MPDNKRKLEKRVNPTTGVKEVRYEGDRLWTEVKDGQ